MASNIDAEYYLAKGIFNKHKKEILFDISGSEFPYANKAQFYMHEKLETFLKAISFLEPSDYYAAKAILRIVFEHYVVAHYIHIRTMNEQNDTCGKEYYEDYFIAEYFKQRNFSLGIDNIKKNLKTANDILNVLKTENPNWTNLTMNDVQKFHTTAHKFDVRKILDYLLNKSEKPNPYDRLNVGFIQFVEDYNTLSSFVHGGPRAEKASFDNSNNIDYKLKVTEALDWTKAASQYIVRYLLLQLIGSSNTDKYIRMYLPISQHVDAFLNTKTVL